MFFSLIELSRNASKSRKTSFVRSRYLAGWCGKIEIKSSFRHPFRTKDTDPMACGLSGSGDTYTSSNLTCFQTLSVLMRARSWSLVPMGTAWSTGNSPFWPLVDEGRICDWFLLLNGITGKFPLTIVAAGGASLYKATSYSSRPGVSSTTPDTRAPCGLWRIRNMFFTISYNNYSNTYKLPEKPAALFCMIVGSGGLHMIINSWSDCITTPGNWGNHTRTWTYPLKQIKH